MKNIFLKLNGLSGKRAWMAPVSGSDLTCHDEKCSPTPSGGQGMLLHGVHSLGLAVIAPDSVLSISSESTVLFILAGGICLLFLWNFILRKRLAKYRDTSSIQGERYRQFFENCPDALFVLEQEGSIVTANDQACRLLRIDRQDLLAKTLWDFVPGVSRSHFTQQFRNCISGEKMRCEGEIQASDATVIPVEVKGSLQCINGKALVQLYIRDNTVLKEVEEQVRSLYNQLDQAAVEAEEKVSMVAEETRLARQEFIAFANHRIRTPLDGIMGMAQLLADTPLDIEQHNFVRTILNSSASLLNVIRSMNEAAEDTTEDTVLQAELVDLRALCETLTITYEPLAAHKGLEFRCDCQSNVPLHVVTDERLISQVLSTLLDNAIKFTEQGLVMLNIECRRRSNDDAELHFHVIDTGIGIDKKIQYSIFEQPDQNRGSGFARCFGSGLSLATGSQLVERMGGKIELISTKGKGSTFYFGLNLPLALPHPSVDFAHQPEAVEDNINEAFVLLVDDNKISQKVVAAMLRKAGCKVDTVGNGKDALTQVRKQRYDVVLMDCQMPVMDGYEATAGIRAMSEPHRSVPIIALTAHSLKHELLACRKCGMDDHIVKPADRQVLVDTVLKYARKSRLERDSVYKAAS